MSSAERDLCLDVEEWSRLPKAVRDRVLAEVQTAADLGYCVDAGDFFFNGIAGVAVTLCDAHGEPAAALSVIVPGENLSQEHAATIAARLTTSASDLERMIGFQPPNAAPMLKAIQRGT